MLEGWANVDSSRGLPRAVVGVLAVALLATVFPATPATALEVRRHTGSRVLGDVSHEHLEVRLGSGSIARGNVLWFREDDPQIDLRPRLARGTAAGLEQMVPMSQGAMEQGAIAGINGGYTLPRPAGVPNGLHVTEGNLVAGQAVGNFGSGGRPIGRGMLGIQPSGRMVMDQILVDLHLDQPDVGAQTSRIDEINRQVWPESETLHNGAPARPAGELLLFDHRFGAPLEVPGGSVLVVAHGMRVGTSGTTEGQILDVRRPVKDTTFAVPPDTHVLLAHGERALELAEADLGQMLRVTTTITPQGTAAEAWHELEGGAAGGQLMVQDGVRRPSGEWGRLAAFSDSHAYGRQPRTAVGRTADGMGMLVTIDGRRPAWSAGVTVAELADTMIDLGAVEAVNLDGGGSTMMTINAQTYNWPSESSRWITDALFLHAPLPPPSRPLANACPEGEVRASGFEDSAGTTHAPAIDCLAWWGVTTGVRETSYAPDAGVTREQMASFVARWIDGVNSRGSGQELPQVDGHRFTDVSDGNVHSGAIARLTDVGIITGRTPTTYEPRGVMTRAQTASLMRAAVEYVTGEELAGGRDTFIDDNGSVHEGNIDLLGGVGVISGVGGFSFRPAGQVTRGAMAALIMRSSDLVVEDGHTTPPS